MSLYGGIRARSFFRHHSRQLVNRIIAEEVLYYKLSLSETKYNIYGESKNKMYNQPILIACLHTLDPQTSEDDTYGKSIAQLIEFRFLRDDLIDLNLVTEAGDIICWQESYYEVDLVVETQFIMGKVPEYSLESDLEKYGESWSMICKSHLTGVNKLNLIKTT
jgi:hypothetical protein